MGSRYGVLSVSPEIVGLYLNPYLSGVASLSMQPRFTDTIIIQYLLSDVFHRFLNTSLRVLVDSNLIRIIMIYNLKGFHIYIYTVSHMLHMVLA